MSFEKAYSKYIQPNDQLTKKQEKLNIIWDVWDDIEAQRKENSFKKFVQYISSFLILEDLYLLFAKDYADSPKNKMKEKISYMFWSLNNWNNCCTVYCQIHVIGAKYLIFGFYSRTSNSHFLTHIPSLSPTALSPPPPPPTNPAHLEHTHTHTPTHTRTHTNKHTQWKIKLEKGETFTKQPPNCWPQNFV